MAGPAPANHVPLEADLRFGPVGSPAATFGDNWPARHAGGPDRSPAVPAVPRFMRGYRTLGLAWLAKVQNDGIYPS